MLWWTLRKLRSKDAKRRREAVTGLANSQDSDLVNHLLNVLYDADWEVRRRAIDVLAKSKTSRAIYTVGGILINTSEKLQARQYAATALASNGSDAAIEILTCALIDHSWDLRKTIVDLLEKSGWKPTTSADRAITALVHFNYDAAVAEGQAAFEPLVQRLEQPRANEKPILDALVAIGGEQVADYFISILPRLVERTVPDRVNRNFSFEQKAKERVRAVLHALSKVGGQHATDYLVAACTDPSMYLLIGSDVATYLADRRFECAVQRLCESLTNEELSLNHRCHVASALGTIGDLRAAVPVNEFFAKLRIEIPSIGVGQNDASKGGIFIAKAAKALINLKETDNAYLIGYVIDLLKAPSSRNGEEPAVGIGMAEQIPNQRVTDTLIELLSSGEYLLPSIASALKRRAWVPSFEQRVAMATATSSWADLDELDSDVIPVLVQLLQHPAGLMRCNACVALEKRGDVRAIIPLERMLKDKQDDVQATARAVLSKLGWKATTTKIDYRIRRGEEPMILAAFSGAHRGGVSPAQVLADFRAEGGAALILDFDSPVRTLFHQTNYRVNGAITCSCGTQVALDLPIEWRGFPGQAFLGYPETVYCHGCEERIVLCLSGSDSNAKINGRSIVVYAHYEGHSPLHNEPPSAGALAMDVTGVVTGKSS